MNTFLLIDKPTDWTSFDAVAVVRRAMGVKRVGHTGTLDPFATGLLLIAVGKCTKLIPFLEKDQKTYRTKILFNKTSDTLDTESPIQELEVKQIFDEDDIAEVLKTQFTGPIEQVPPAFSALKVNGQRAYDLARKGETVELKSRQTEIYSTKVIETGDDWVEIELTVAAGFYVRSFARDLAEALGTVGMCGELRRTAVGSINIETCTNQVLNPIDLKEAGATIPETAYLDPTEILPELPQISIEKSRLDDWSHGRAIKVDTREIGEALVTCNDRTIGLGLLGQGSLQPKVVF